MIGRNGVESCDIGEWENGWVGGCDGMKGGEGDGRDIRSGMFFFFFWREVCERGGLRGVRCCDFNEDDLDHEE